MSASMGSGRGDRNQHASPSPNRRSSSLQWGPVVVTGIRWLNGRVAAYKLWLQWGPVVVTGIRRSRTALGGPTPTCFNGVRSW